MALCLYKKEVGPRPEKVYHGRKTWFLKNREKMNHTHYLCNFGALKCTGVWCIYLTPTGHLPLENTT